MEDDLNLPPESAEIWELALFLSKENVLLRSFLEYLRTPSGDPDVKMSQLTNWEKHVGFLFGNPALDADAKSMFQTVLGASAGERQEAIRRVIGLLQSKYFPEM